jgi:hypothetical protein
MQENPLEIHVHIQTRPTLTSLAPMPCLNSSFRLSAHAYSAYTISLTQAFAALNIERQYTLRQLKDPDQSGVSWNTQAARKAGALRRLTGLSWLGSVL